MYTVRQISAALLFVAAAHATWAQTIDGRVVAIHDGDTVTLVDAGRVQHRIRLAGIDAPETGRGMNQPGQPYGQASKRSLESLIHGRTVRAECQGRDKYGRLLCVLWLGRTDVNVEQVRRGMAWAYRGPLTPPGYMEAEEMARVDRRGLWREADPMPPSQWRRDH